MAWSTPRTWVAGETVTAAICNTHIRDNFKAIGDPWTSYTPTIVGVTTSSVFGKYISVGKLVMVRITITISAAPTTNVTASLPVTASTAMGNGPTAALGSVSGLRTGVTYQVGAAYLAASTTVGFISHGGGAAWGPGVPVTWANTDIWSASFTYEAA